ncbi:MAG: ATP-binding protein [Nitrospiria bacterium]
MKTPIEINALFHILPGPVALLDGNLRILKASASFRRLFHLSPNTAEHPQFFEFGKDRWRFGKLQFHLEEVLSKGKAVLGFEIVRIDSSNETQGAIRLNAGRISPGVLLLAIENDVDAKRLSAEFEAVLEYSPDATVIGNKAGRIRWVNRETESMFGYRRRDLVGQPIEIFLPLRLRERHRGHQKLFFSNPIRRPMGSGLELLGCRKDGCEFPVEVSLSPLETEEGSFVISTIRDISERKEVERELARRAEALARSNAELERFSYVASHDLQEPLRMVASYSQLLARRYKGKLGSDADTFIDFMVDGAVRMQGLINDLLTLSRVGVQEQEFEATDCNGVLDRVVRVLRGAIEDTGGTVTYDPLPTIMAGTSQLIQLFQNLIGNALKFHGAHPPGVHIAAEEEGNTWRFSVRDNGIGIDPAYHDRIFTVFQRLHGRNEFTGTGIGLAVCKKIVERLNGRIWVESAPGSGSTFYFTLPK